MNTPDPRSLSLEQLEGAWPEPRGEVTRLVATVHEVRRRPIGMLGPEELRLLISQGLSLRYLLPLAVEMLRVDPMVEGDLYPGDLLSAALFRGPQAWADVPDAAQEMCRIVAGIADLAPGIRRAAQYLEGLGGF
ncbi:hypothetical protein KDL01_34220 [Actinospica durhamensis]|uniref:Uncharacterized protein n=1 Tax=Actinospica durhamensis TaxID=1508375 RepID=A0A941IU06_9ACTN|nr:contact-dependent growth inhibition system immunity protein [Actinospica durhamensis]MBR7838377.1 hypothetical protein [Actinospica durhamensis]